ncbi:MAG: sulfatase [Bacteroidales bacterium]|nr:sulfatase [Bacteroidales bacterium]MCF8389579.1 sulfatase [Bacteroidales bacterium]
MNSKFKISLFAFGFSFIVGTGCTMEKSPPNIIFILADDLGFSQLGCYGSSYYRTPNIDNLSAEGIRFINAYAAAAVCSPTRASIMTGKYPAKLHLTDFITGNDREDYPLHQPEWQKFLPLEHITFAELLQKKGYKTALFGKWHLSPEKTPPLSLPYNPDKQGFDETFITYKPSGKMIQPWQDAENDAHNVDTITNLALDFMKRNRNNPFFLFVSHNTIHDPLKEKYETIRKYEELKAIGEPENNPVIAAMIERLDQSCGRIFEKVQELGLENNTIIIFFSDNGGSQAYAAQTPFRAGKGWLYEGGIREPLIVKWKGEIKPGTISESLVSSIDLFPTFLELAEANGYNPEDIDGKSLVPILYDPSIEIHQTLFWHYPHYHSGSGMVPAGALRSGNWKLIEWYEKSLLGEEEQAYELFNLETDEGETTNLADSLTTITGELTIKLQKWRHEVYAQMPVPNDNY